MKCRAVPLYLVPMVLLGAELKPATSRAFDRYVQSASAQQEQRRSQGRFLWSEGRPEIDRSALAKGDIFIERLAACENGREIEVPDGMVHDWAGVAFIPRANVNDAVNLIRDADRHKEYYQPEVIGSKLVSRNGDHHVTSLRLLKKKLITVVLDVVYDNRVYRVSDTRTRMESYSTSVREVSNPGKADERVLAVEEGHGFLWRMNSSWTFEQKDGGVYVEARAISLSRDIPFGLGAIVKPFLESVPRESFCNTLISTRAAILHESKKDAGCAIVKPPSKSKHCE